MRRGPRLALQVALVLAGLFLAGFFYLLFAIADCSPDCQARGERAVPVALAAAGVGLAAAGVLLPRGGRTAAGGALALAGALATGISAWLLVQGEGGWHVGALAGGIAALALGVWLLRPR